MKIEKLPSGSYRIRKMYHGKSYTVITDYKPTQKEAIQLLAAELDSANDVLPAGGTFLSYSNGSRYEIALHLAVYGVRRSEICALLASDLDGNTLTIDKALVLNDQNEYVIKSTKTTEGTRRIYVSDYVADLIRSTGFIYHGDPHSINEYLHRAQDRLGIERFSLHKLRHYYASMSHSLGIPDAYIMESGGWKSDAVLKNVYRKAQQDKAAEMQRFASDYISQLSSRS
jgi:integrase